jgi:alpha-D-xyloside xylohydrolase
MTAVNEAGALSWATDDEILRIEPWGRDALRVRATRGGELPEPLGADGALLDVASPKPEVEVGDDGASITNGLLRARLDADGSLRFERSDDGRPLLAEHDPHFVDPRARHYGHRPDGYWRVEAAFTAHEDERLYGLGQQQHGRLDQKGCVIDLVQRNTQVAVPFLLSSRGYGFLWHSPAVGRVELADNGTRWVAEASRGLDYWITTADSPAGILERYSAVTGRAPLLPERAAGFWQSNLRYRSQTEVMSVANEYQRRGLPLDVIVIDAGHWTVMGDWRFDEELWPDPGAMVRELDAMGVQVIVSVWPTVNPTSENLETMREQGLLARTTYGPPHASWLFDNRPPGALPLELYDATDPAARRFLGERLREGYLRHGIEWFWLDADEPEIKPLEPGRLEYAAGPGEAVHDLYPHLHARAVWEAMREAGVEAPLTLNRSVWAGSQRYGAALWSGDIHSSWAALRAQIPAGLNVGMAGIPWWGTDIGGFKGGVSSDPGFRELLVRWFQYAVFTPVFRLHGLRQEGDSGFEDITELVGTEGEPDEFSLAGFSGGPNEVWSFGEEVYELIAPLLHLRRRLRPYVVELMRTAHEHGLPPMRAMLLEFPDDAEVWALADQFMFGPDLLVAPILEPGATAREVYLPASAAWSDAWTGAAVGAGRHVAAAPAERIPVFVRDGAPVGRVFRETV